MPIYEYECSNCHTRFDKLQSITADPLTVCLNCGGGPIRRVLQPVGIIFKGSGWYINDSRKSSSGSIDPPSSGGGAAKSDGDSKGNREAKSDGDSKGNAEAKSDSGPSKSSTPSSSSSSSGE